MRAIIAACLLLAACGGGDSAEPFLGTYRLTSHRWNLGQGMTISCGDAGAEVQGGALYIALIVDPFFEDPNFVRLQECAGPGDCVDEPVTMSPGGPGLIEENANTQTSGGITSCGLYASRYTAALSGEASDFVRVEVRHWSDYIEAPESECMPERAAALRETDACREVEIWEGPRVP